ncbi:MAG: mechanosensitive ion channel family protein [Rhodospirillaceae bacterium]
MAKQIKLISWATRIKQLALPLLFTTIFGSMFYYGGQASYELGVVAFDTSHRAFEYVLSLGVVIGLTVFVQRFVQFIILDGLAAPALGTPVPRLLSQLSTLIVYLLGFAAIFGIVFKQDLTALLAASGIAGLVFGMALREIILDIFTGLALNIDRPLRIGDDVLVHRVGDKTIEGRVIEISWRTTRLSDLGGNTVVVSNSKLASSTITNYSQPHRSVWTSVRVTLDVGIPPDRVERILFGAATQALAEIGQDPVPAPLIRINDVTAYGVEYAVMFETTLLQRHAARSLMFKLILTHIGQAGLRPSIQESVSPLATVSGIESRPGPEQIAILLHSHPLFHDMDTDDVCLLAKAAIIRAVDAGTLLAQSGEVATIIILVLEGMAFAEPLTRDIHAVGDKGNPAAARLGPGHLIGAEATLTGDGYARTVRAQTPSLIAELDHRALHGMLGAKPVLAQLLARRIADGQRREEVSGPNRPGLLTVSDADRTADVFASICRTFADLRLAPVGSVSRGHT